MIRQKRGREPAEPASPDIDGGSASTNLQEIHEAIAKARGHAAQWLAQRESMAKTVAEYEALTSTQRPSDGCDPDTLMAIPPVEKWSTPSLGNPDDPATPLPGASPGQPLDDDVDSPLGDEIRAQRYGLQNGTERTI
ncbi:MAG: hypothetical protein WC729_26090 [Sphingomonas sp.]|jgi:hypothetical protein|uniref:hypothetical protein n=1 Tax=Sphingomonas sp. TaxID=28214 RepID=UPI00356A5DA1